MLRKLRLKQKKWLSYKKKRARRLPEVLPTFHYYYYLRVN